MKIRVLLADDHSVVRAGIKSLAEGQGGITVVGEATDGQELIKLARTTPADVFVVDIEMPVLSGIEAMEHLLKERPGSKVVILSMYRDRVLVERAFRAGARGYVLKESVAEDIVRAVQEVAQGKYWISPQISAYLVDRLVTTKDDGEKESVQAVLTRRQREIIKLIGDGLTEKQIGQKLNLSHNTVHVHKTRIMKTLDIHTKAELIRYALRHAIIR
jgi:DNA-binding NarL/FixJ family response regulator